MSAQIRLLLADGSPKLRATLQEFFGGDPGLRVVGTAADGREAVDLALAHRPDVVLLDFELSRLDGLQAAREIMTRSPTHVLLMTALHDERAVRLALEASSVGALELISKARPEDDLQGWLRRLRTTITLMAEVPVVRRVLDPALMREPLRDEKRAKCVGLVASTGGPSVLEEILVALPADLAVPVVAVQHMAPGFVPRLVQWLRERCALPVVEARSGEACARGAIYFAPDGCDLEIEAGRFRVEPATNGYFGSGDRLLQSIAHGYAALSAGAVLTGMGEDGARGLLAIRRAGGTAVAQEEGSCVVFGMPRAARDLGAAERLLPPAAISELIRRLAGEGRPPPAQSPAAPQSKRSVQ